MHYGKIIGTVVATQKSKGMEQLSLKVIQPLNKSQEPTGEPIVAADSCLNIKDDAFMI